MTEELYIRPTWDEYFLEVMHALAKRATCGRGRTACVIVKDNQIISSGYVGAPAGLPHCDEAGHLMKQVVNEDGSISEHCVRTIHAEQNAIIQAAKYGININGATLYCTHQPCVICAKMIINSGIKRIVYRNGYPDEFSLQLLNESGVEIEQYKE